MNARVQLSDVARESGVSVSVVSRVLNGDKTLRIRDEKRARVLEVARQLGYRPNAAGRSLRTKSASAIGVMLPKLTNPFFADFLQGVEDACDEADLTPILGRSERLSRGSSILERMIGEGRVDGFILQLTDELTEDAVNDILGPAIPRVLVQSHTVGHPGSVVLDVEAGVRMATEYLISIGHVDIGFATGLPQHDTAVIRERAFRDAMERAGLEVVEDWIARFGFYFSHGEPAFRSIWSGRRRPTAILAANVNVGLGILNTAQVSDVSVPDQLSVMSLHDSELAAGSVPPMTVVKLPVYELGVTAVGELRDVMAGGTRRALTITDPPPELIVRRSTRPRSG